MLALFGPTASGKSAVAEQIAARIPAEVVSADAMQVYAGLPILTNQPRTPTQLVAIWPLSHEASVGAYAPLAHAAIDAALAADRTAVVTGGTGLYLRAALAELRLPPPPPPGLRERLDHLYDHLGPDRAHDLLRDRDPAAAAAVHRNDRRRVVRALELAELGASLRPERSGLWADDVRHPTVLFVLDVDPVELAERIRQRTREMFERGVEAEVRAARAQELSSTARHVIGLKELAELAPAEAAEAIVSRTIRYAAYQRKWLRRLRGAVSLAADRPPEEIADEVLEVARARQCLPARRAG